MMARPGNPVVLISETIAGQSLVIHIDGLEGLICIGPVMGCMLI
jgi:hypothetical protein